MLAAKYDSNGNLKWLKIYEESIIAGIDLKIYNNKIYICGIRGKSYFNNPDFNLMITQIVEYFNLSVKLPGEQYWVEVAGVKKQGPEAKFYLPAGTYKVYAISIEQYGDTRYIFTKWSDASTENPKTIELYSDTVLKAEYIKQHYIRVESTYSTTSGEKWYSEGVTATVSIAQTVIDHGNNTRRIFRGWESAKTLLSEQQTHSFIVTQPLTLTAKWQTQYYISVHSDYATATGEKWYNKGETATITISQTKIDEVLFSRTFKGWKDETGTIVSTQPTYTFTVNGPKTLTTVWEHELNLLFLAGIGVAATILLTVIIILLKKMKLKPLPPPPPPPPSAP